MQENKNQFGLFICHASEDKSTVVLNILKALSAHQITIWYDEYEIQWGDDILKKILIGIRSSRIVLAVISPSFLNKKWTNFELEQTFYDELTTNRSKLLPLIVGGDLITDKFQAKYPRLNDLKVLSWTNNELEIANKIMSIIGEANSETFCTSKKQILGVLNSLSASQLDELMFIYDYPIRHVPGNASHSQKAILLLRHAEQKQDYRYQKLYKWVEIILQELI